MLYNNDPLLRNAPTYSLFNSAPQNVNDTSLETYAQLYKQQLMMEMQRQQDYSTTDWLSELDKTLKNLDPSTVNILNNDYEFSVLNGQLQSLIQAELMSLVKIKINSNPSAVDNMKKQMDLIKNTTNKIQQEEKQNLSELNDYMKNYSHLTFDEYRKLKNGTAITNQEEVVTTETLKTNKRKTTE
jgi:hypothetical protein